MCNISKTTKKIFILITVFILFSFLKFINSQPLLRIVYCKDLFEYFPKNEGNFNNILLKTFKKNKDENLIIAIDSNRFMDFLTMKMHILLKTLRKTIQS